MTYVSRSDWGANPAWHSNTAWHAGQPSSVTVHAVGAVVGEHTDYAAQVRSIQAHAVGKGLSDIDYNFLVDYHGNIYEGRGWAVQSGAQGVGNATSLAVCYLDLGDGDVDFTYAAQDAILSLAKGRPIYPHRYWNQPNTAAGHSDYVTFCPGNEISAWCYNHGSHTPLPTPEVPDMDAADKQIAQATLDTVARLETKVNALDEDLTKVKRSLFDSEGVGIVGKTWRAVSALIARP